MGQNGAKKEEYGAKEAKRAKKRAKGERGAKIPKRAPTAVLSSFVKYVQVDSLVRVLRVLLARGRSGSVAHCPWPFFRSVR